MGAHLLTAPAPLTWSFTSVWSDVPAALLCAVAFFLLFAAAEIVRRVVHVPVEVTRKGVHIGAGLVTLALPHLFHSLVTLVALGLGFFAVMWLTRRRGLLESVHSVQRQTTGAVIYPLGITALVVLSGGRPVLFELPLLVMVLADPAASLGGMTVGRHPYVVRNHRRTVEGSASFFVMAFLTSFFLLLGRGGLPLVDALAVAGTVAGILLFVEAWSVGGWDNLTLPVAGLGVASAALYLDGAARIVMSVFVVLIVTGAAVVAVSAARKGRGTVPGVQPEVRLSGVEP